MSQHGNEYLRVDEFTRRMDSMEGSIAAGFEEVRATVQPYGERIAVLEQAHRAQKKKSVGWSTAVASGILIAFEAVRSFFK